MPLVRSWSGEIICEVTAIKSPSTGTKYHFDSAEVEDAVSPRNAYRVCDASIEPVRTASEDHSSKSISSTNMKTSTIEPSVEENVSTTPMGNMEHNQTLVQGMETRDIRGGTFYRKRYLEYILSIQNSRKKKEDESVKYQNRMKKRATLLKQKYEDAKVNHQFSHTTIGSFKEHCEVELADEKIILNQSQISAMALRLSKSSRLLDIPCDDYGKWKRKHGVRNNQNVFCMTGWYPSIREYLLARGWFFNPERDAPFFDLKFTLSSSDINFESLKDYQIVNHFKGVSCLTTKAGLMRSLNKINFFGLSYQDKDQFFPRSYDLSVAEDIQDFHYEYYVLHAEGTLTRLLRRCMDGGEKPKANLGVVRVLCQLLMQRKSNVDDSFVDIIRNKNHQMISTLQRIIIQNSQEWLYRPVTKIDILSADPDVDKIMATSGPNLLGDASRKLKEKIPQSLFKLETIGEEEISQIQIAIECTGKEPQQLLNGELTNNLWILKPAGKSRGRGITVVHSIQCIMEHIRTMGSNSQFVIQKYIENPLTIAGRKFDIRQWVMITDWDPLTIWFYNDCYIRVASVKYDSPQTCKEQNVKTEWIKNKFRHLVNNSINKNNQDFSDSFVDEETGEKIEGCMWSLKDFKKWLIHVSGEDKWEASLAPKIKEMMIDSLLCAQEDIVHRKRSWVVVGIDVMIDNNFNPWLIEINASPACDYSTAVTEKFIKNALPDVLKVNLLHSIGPENIDTGGWEQIYRGAPIPKVAIGQGINIALKGIKLKTKKKNRLRDRWWRKDQSAKEFVQEEDGNIQNKQSKLKSNGYREQDESTNKENSMKEKGEKRLGKKIFRAKDLLPLKKVTINALL